MIKWFHDYFAFWGHQKYYFTDFTQNIKLTSITFNNKIRNQTVKEDVEVCFILIKKYSKEKCGPVGVFMIIIDIRIKIKKESL